ncbi:chorismate synthase [candidate division GN15 bacterium]|nr:chorismate synthase [candidate division GN15 bacterium]
MLTYLTSGESHGPQLTAIVDGLPAGLTVAVDELNFQMARRQKGYGRGGRMKIEQDQVEFVSGLRHSRTLGGPVTMVIRNRDWENWVNIMDPVSPLPDDLHLREQRLAHETTMPRPGHADLAGGIKYNHKDLRNVLERASARETAARVAVGSLCRQLLEQFGVRFASHVVQIGEVAVARERYTIEHIDDIIERSEASEVRCLVSEVEAKMIEAIKTAKKKRDSLGGVAEVIVTGLPVGLGGFSQGRHRLDSQLVGALMSIPSAKGAEIGLGFAAAARRGSEVHDEIFYDTEGDPRKKKFVRKTNRAGGIEGGITTGEPIVARVAVKPISTLNRPLQTVDVVTKEPAEAMVERTDNCVVPAVAVITEAVMAIELTEVFLDKFGRDNMAEITRNVESFLATDY